VRLSGHVTFELPQALITADTAHLTSPSAADGDAIVLKKHIRVHLKEGGTITAPRAVIRPMRHRAKFMGSLPLERVVYSSESDFSLTCDELEVESAQEGHPCVEAKGNVEIRGPRGFQIAAQQVTIHPADPPRLPSQDEGSELICFQGDVALHHEDLGQLSSPGPLYLTRSPNGSWNAPDLIFCRSELVWETEKEGHPTGRLVSPGGAIIDWPRGVALFSGQKEPVSYDNRQGQATGDRLRVNFSSASGDFTIQEATLEGSVRIHLDAEATPLYVLADRASYHPEDASLHLTAGEGQRVLLLERNQPRVSAEGVAVDCRTHEVQGIGNVRVTLSEQEQLRLREAFGRS
jgi:hypothetical protein